MKDQSFLWILMKEVKHDRERGMTLYFIEEICTIDEMIELTIAFWENRYFNSNIIIAQA